MSASNKKKLRHEQEVAKLTEKQLAAQKEAKQLKIYSTIFVIAIAVMLVIAVIAGGNKLISNSGIAQRNTVAMTVNGEKISNIEMTYFFVDYINSYANENSYFLSYLLDTTKPLDQQMYSTTETWADYFLAAAQENARSVYTLWGAAKAVGHTLTGEEQQSLTATLSNINFYAQIYGYASVDDYLKMMYGNGASMESYKAYCERSMLASSYYNATASALTFDEAELRAYENENYHKFSSFTYHSYYLSTSKFLEGGTVNENGTTVYSDEEKAASVVAAEDAAKILTDPSITTVEQLDAAIAALPINEGVTNAKSSLYEDELYTSIDVTIAEWLGGDRKPGDLAYIPRTSTSTDENGQTITTVIGYYVVYFVSCNENKTPLVNVRHILVGFEGGTTDANGVTTYSETEMAAAEEAANEILREWKAGAASEESFATLATVKSTDPGSASNGGLYTDVAPGQMVQPFNDWCFDESRAVGDTGVVKTEYGFHVMYFSGFGSQNYRDYMITNALINDTMNDWYQDLLAANPVTVGNCKYVPMNRTLNGN